MAGKGLKPKDLEESILIPSLEEVAFFRTRALGIILTIADDLDLPDNLRQATKKDLLVELKRNKYEDRYDITPRDPEKALSIRTDFFQTSNVTLEANYKGVIVIKKTASNAIPQEMFRIIYRKD